MKKLFLLLILGVLTLLPGKAFKYQGINYEISSQTDLTVTVGYNYDYSGDLIIPETVEYFQKTYSVTSIGGSAFSGCSGLTSVTIPNTVTEIGNGAFNGCSSLSSLTFEDGETSITLGYNDYSSSNYYSGKGLFADCPLETLYLGRNCIVKDFSSSFPERYGYSPFANIRTLTEVTIGDNVTFLLNYFLYGCSGLTSIEIPNSVTKIRDYAFNGCSSLSSLVFEDGETSISLGYNQYSSSSTGKGLFADCPLENIYVGRNLSYAIFDAFFYYGYSPFANITTLTEVTIGDNVTSLPDYILYGCSGLTSIEIPNSVTSIGRNAFNECTSLSEVYTSDLDAWCNINFGNYTANPLYYAGHLYLDNDEITNLAIPEGVTSIKNYAFYGCSGLTSVDIPNSVTEIGGYAFSNCSGLTSIEIPNSVTEIGGSAFSGCSGLTRVEIPNSVTKIGEDPFSDCQLTEIELLSITPPSYYSSFSSNSDMATLVIPYNTLSSYLATDWKNFLKIEEVDGDKAYIGNDGVFNYRFIESLREATLVQDNSYRNMKNVSIPDRVVCDLYETEEFYKVTSIGDRAFENCNMMTNLKLPSGLVSINRAAFSGCSGLQSIDLPASVTTIGSNAFYGCGGITKVNIVDLAAWCNIDFGNKYANPLGRYKYSEAIHHLYLDNDEITDLTIPDGVTSIKNYAFYDCRGLTSVTVPNSVTEIGYDAFYYCSGLKRVNIADLTSWCNIDFGNENANPLYYAKHLYSDNEEITNLAIPEGVSSIKNYAFYGNSGLTSVTIPNSVTEIGKDAFNECSGLQRLTFEDGVEDLTIGSNVFFIGSLYVGRNLSGQYSFYNGKTLTFGGFVTTIPSNPYKESTLTSVTINPGGEVVIEDGAFSGCRYLAELVLPEDIAEIGANAFSGTGLKNIIVPGGVIAENAFAGCNLDNIILGKDVESIGEKAFDGSNAIKNVYATPTTPPAAQNNTFSYYEAQLWVPEEAIDTYYNITRCWYRFSGKPLVCPENIMVDGPASFTGKPGETLQLTATIAPANVTLDRVLWKSTNPAVATVDNNGLVTIHNFQSSDETMTRAAEEGFCQIIASTLYEESPVAVVNIEALTTSIEYINSEDMSAGTSAAFDQNDIYTLQGICVKRQASQSDIDALAPGIYIIGGKRVIIR